MDEIINYTNNSPENTNPNVLRGLLGNMNISQNESEGGSDIFVVNMTFTFDESNNTVITSDKTVDEIRAAASAGKTIMGKCIVFETEPYYTTFTTEISTDPNWVQVVFWYTYVYIDNPGGVASTSDEINTIKIYWDSVSSKWFALTYRYQLTPVSE